MKICNLDARICRMCHTSDPMCRIWIWVVGREAGNKEGERERQRQVSNIHPTMAWKSTICLKHANYLLPQWAQLHRRSIVRLANSCTRPWRFNSNFGCVLISCSGGALGTGYCSCIFIDCRYGVPIVTVRVGDVGVFSLPTPRSYGFSAAILLTCAYNTDGMACNVEVASIGPSPCGIDTVVVAMIFSESFKSMTSTFSPKSVWNFRKNKNIVRMT